MTKVKIAKLKAQLSHYLKRVKSGDEIIVTERDTPIARVLPFQELKATLFMTKAVMPAGLLGRLKIPKRRGKSDSLKILLATRGER